MCGDAQKLSKQGLVTFGCVDLRNLAHRTRFYDNSTKRLMVLNQYLNVLTVLYGFLLFSSRSATSLKGIASHVLGVDLKKSLSITRSNWEADVLSKQQVPWF